MPNNHQKFTGIHLNGSGRPGTGTWKSLCGESNDDIIYPSLISQHWSFDTSLDRGVSRAYAAIKGKHFVMSLTGVRQQVTLHETHKIEVVSLRNGSTVHAGRGPVTLYEDLSSAYLVMGTT